MMKRMTDERMAEIDAYAEAGFPQFESSDRMPYWTEVYQALKAERDFADKKVAQIRMTFDEDLKMRTLKQQEKRIAELKETCLHHAQIETSLSDRIAELESKLQAERELTGIDALTDELEQANALLDEIEQAISEFDKSIIDELDCLDRIDKVLDKREKNDE